MKIFDSGRETALTIVLWGPTNVGKSSLFNKLTRSRKAIVANRPGVTVDSHSLSVQDDEGRNFRIIDSGGVGSGLSAHALKNEIEDRAMAALDLADLVLFVADGTNYSEEIRELSQKLRKLSGKREIPTWLVLNKTDRNDFSEVPFYELGYKNSYPISAEHSLGFGDLWGDIEEFHNEWKSKLKPEDEVIKSESKHPRVMIIGRPNVGKSTLMNALTKKNVSAVSSVAGTTRDSVTETIELVEGVEVLLTDTAGMRRAGSVEREVEWVAIEKIRDRARTADIAILLIDADEGISDQDSTIAGFALDAGLSLIIAFNKWDLVKESNDLDYKLQELTREKDMKMAFLAWCPLVRISAKTGIGIKTLKENIVKVAAARMERVQTSTLNSIFEKRIKNASGVTTASTTNSEKLYYMSQVDVAPPEFVVFSNLPPDRVHFSFRRYVTNILRDEFGFMGTPIKIHFKERS